jgi:peptide/nickel transport system permease protein/oligopeptide transport system permease protein
LVSGWFLVFLAVVSFGWPVLLRVCATGGAKEREFARIYYPESVSDLQFSPPGPRHWFGTDVHGRDLLSRVLSGAAVSLLVALTGALVSGVIGVLWGSIAGYAGGRLDGAMMRFVDILYSLPSIIFVIVLIATLEGVLKNRLAMSASPYLPKFSRLAFLVVGLGSVSWLTMARIVRGEVLSLRTRPFVEAARVLGAGPIHILMRHIIPNTIGIVVVYWALTIPAIILYESFLSYLGLGIQPPMASWGSLISEAAEQINSIRIYWWLVGFPAGILVLTLLAVNSVAGGLRDAWDVKRRSAWERSR